MRRLRREVEEGGTGAGSYPQPHGNHMLKALGPREPKGLLDVGASVSSPREGTRAPGRVTGELGHGLRDFVFRRANPRNRLSISLASRQRIPSCAMRSRTALGSM